MHITDNGNMLIIKPQPGYILHNIKEDTYYRELYANKKIDLSNIEEVVDENAIANLCFDVDLLKEKEQNLNKIGKLVAKQVTEDVVALELSVFYDEWSPNIVYSQNEYLLYNAILYKSLLMHTSQDNWTPDISPSLYAKVLIDPTGETILDWVQPDSTNGYMKGDRVKFEGLIYESLIDNNIWSPSAYPTAWQEVK